MKKTVIIAVLALLALVILVKSGVIDALVIFLLVGRVPGTDYMVPSTFMLLAITSVIWLLLFRFTAVEALHSISFKRSVKNKASARKKRLPKSRFGQI